MSLRKSALLRLCATSVLLLGLGCAVAVYLTASDAPVGGVGYLTQGGEVFTVNPEDSRSFQRGVEYIGGKSALLGVELREWLAGLWSREALAVALGLASAIVSALLLRAADRRDR
ncbi:MAG: hypothetical protein AUJ49_00075 [Desulfovibrionaceae bacterium CG1_02_65_16]|nr:MAG: hypothetical protein AUJ49_00075 [Desulfovibrionaceae bacterium CG1_02_65_16]